jgi:hypothetical protein
LQNGLNALGVPAIFGSVRHNLRPDTSFARGDCNDMDSAWNIHGDICSPFDCPGIRHCVMHIEGFGMASALPDMDTH